MLRIHVPSALSASATVCATLCFTGISTVNPPDTVSGEEVIENPCEGDHSDTQSHQIVTGKFVRCGLDSKIITFGAYRNLASEFNLIQKLFGYLAAQWGIATPMAEVLRQFAVMFR